ncbi:unnamed protein product [Somion occarium]|uniref:Lysine-specific metallo-endopeptidase domain-containing protein n=1 Tax=Somion occarium TaxID=3059160 RepID=A0ABP1CH98_9APHY
MFSSAVRSALVVLVASAIAVSATPGLSLKVSGPTDVEGVDKFKVIATIINTGDETLKILNDPLSPLSNLPTETFAISREETGATPKFSGVKVKYVPEIAAKVGDEKAFTILAPGQSVSLEHDLSSAYNFTSSGEGKYTVEANNLFHIVDPATNAPVALRADAEVHSAAITGTLAIARRSNTRLTKRATFTGCSSSQQSTLNTAASSAQSYAASSLSYLQQHTSSTTRYTTWFGTYTAARHSTVLSHYTNLNGNTYSSYHYDCTCTDSGVYAYVYPDDFGHVYLCGVFWQAPNTGTDSRAGTLIHESSHFTSNGGTDDIVYGQTAAKNLAQSNPSQAIINADSHEYFSENNPALA